MDAQWEEFTNKTNYRSEMLRVSLNGRGHFMLNQKAADALGAQGAVVLFYDRANRLIGLKGSSPEVEHSYELKRQNSSQNYMFRAKSFCAYYNINVGDTVVFNDVKVQDDMIVLSLENVSEVVRRARFTDLPAVVPERVIPPQQPKFSTLLRMRQPDAE